MPVSDDKDYVAWDTEIVDGVLACLVPIFKTGQAREVVWLPAMLFGPKRDRRPIVHDATMAYKWAPEFGAYVPWKPTRAAKTHVAAMGMADTVFRMMVWTVILGVGGFCAFGASLLSWYMTGGPGGGTLGEPAGPTGNNGISLVVLLVGIVITVFVGRRIDRKIF